MSRRRHYHNSVGQGVPQQAQDELWGAVGDSLTLGRQVETGLQGIAGRVERIEEVLSRPAQPVNWPAIGSLCVAVIVMAGAFLNARLNPMDDQLKNTDERFLQHLATLPNHYAEIGALQERSTWNKEITMLTMQMAVENRSHAAELAKAYEALLETVRGIDQQGPRTPSPAATEALNEIRALLDTHTSLGVPPSIPPATPTQQGTNP